MSNVLDERTSKDIQSAIKIDGDAVRGHLDELVRSTVEDTLNKHEVTPFFDTCL